MKIWKWALFLAAAALLSGCDHFWDVPSGSGSGSGGGSGTASGLFYVLNQKTSQIAGFTFPANSTTATAVTNSPYSLATAASTMAVSPNGAFLYVATAAGIYVYSVNTSSGALTVLNSGNVISSDPASAMKVDSSGTWLVEGVSGLAQVNAIPLDPTTGVLSSGATEQSRLLPSGAAVQQIAVTPSSSTNSYVFVTMGTTGTAVIPFNASVASGSNPFGTVSTINPLHTQGGDIPVAVDENASRPMLYVGETVALSGSGNTGALRVFNIGANSTMTELTGSSYPYATGGTGPSAILSTASYVYVANRAVSGSNNGNITAFGITTTGTAVSLTAVSNGTISAGVSTNGLAEESSGTYVLAVNSSGSPDLNAFTITSTGALKSYATSATGNDPVQAVSIVAP